MLTASPRTPSVKENQRKLEWKETAILSDLQLKYATFANSAKTFGQLGPLPQSWKGPQVNGWESEAALASKWVCPRSLPQVKQASWFAEKIFECLSPLKK